jgi:hypothetical protein
MTDDERDRLDTQKLVANAMSERIQFWSKLLDTRRNIDEECGNPLSPTPEMYKELFDRHPIARKAVKLIADECWKNSPRIYETEDADDITEFEEAWDALGSQLQQHKSWHKQEQGSAIYSIWHRADILSGIGNYGVIVYGIDDGLDMRQPAAGITELNSMPGEAGQSIDFAGVYSINAAVQRRRLLYMHVYPQSLAQIVQWEQNWSSPRYGQPVLYSITMNDPSAPLVATGMPSATRYVHWTRVQHIADNVESSTCLGVPRLQAILNNLHALAKIYGAAGEGYWKSCFSGLSIESVPQLGDDLIVDKAGLKDMIEQYQNGLQRYMALTGFTAKSLAPSIVDPTPHIAAQLEAIAIALDVPMRLLKGSERGELSSGQDSDEWGTRVYGRQNRHCTPVIAVPSIDRLIWLGVLPEPESYCAEWPELAKDTPQERAELAGKIADVMSKYEGFKSHMALKDLLTRVLWYTEEEADAIIDAAEEQDVEAPEEAQADAV